MKGPRSVLVVLAVLAASPAPVSAQERRAEGVAALALARGALRRCPGIALPLPAAADLQEGWGTWLEVTLQGPLLIVRDGDSGQGVDAEHGMTHTAIRLDRCSVVAARTAWSDGARSAQAWVTRRGRVPAADVERGAGATGHPQRAADAAGRLQITGVNHCWQTRPIAEPNLPVAVSEPLTPPQPWMRGPPQASAAVFWPRRVLDRIGVSLMHDEMYGPALADGAISFAVGQPMRIGVAGGIEIWQSTL